jgi:predicted nucleic acid-binding protein
MLVVSDATPLNILIRIGQVDVLPQLFEKVVIPPAVARELSHPNTPESIYEWFRQPPDWLETKAPCAVSGAPTLGLGEREAISLADDLKAQLLLVDDKAARLAATQLGIPIMGTVGILKEAARRGLLELRSVLELLRATDFFLSDKLLEHLLADPGATDPFQ